MKEYNDIPWSITVQEQELAQKCLSFASEAGATACRVTINKSNMSLFCLLNGELDKVTSSSDRSLTFNIFAGGGYGVFSTNRLEEEALKSFISKAVETVLMMAPDEFRSLPDPSRTAKNSEGGLELGMYDKAYAMLSPQDKIDFARKASIFGKAAASSEYEIVSEEVEYNDSIFDNYIFDSNGTRCRQIESSFEIGCQTTIQDRSGDRYDGFWWDSAVELKNLVIENCGAKALERAVSQMNPSEKESGRYSMVVENEVASKLVNPVLNALGGTAIQQCNSFLADKKGEKVFSEGLTITDMPDLRGQSGARLYDSEGVAAARMPIIEKGVVKNFFINTYISRKMGIDPTIEDAVKPVISPWWCDDTSKKDVTLQDLMEKCGEGILVTGFNGGNANQATGDFSYGVEGFMIRDGKRAEPVRSMVMTGNFITLWNNLLAAGSDARKGMTKVIPSLLFKDVDFSG